MGVSVGWTNQQTESITVPPEGGTVKIVIGPDDPFAVAAGMLASIVFNWQTDEAFLLGVLFDGLHTGQLRLVNADTSGVVADYWNCFYNEISGYASFMMGGVDTNEVGITSSDFTIDTVSQGRGLVQDAAITTSSAGISAETVVLTLPATVFKGGRAYEISVGGRVQASVANSAVFRLRFGTSTGGSLLLTYGAIGVPTSGATGAANVSCSRYVVRDPSDGDLTTQMVVTLASTTGTDTLLAAANEPAYVLVTDVGAWNTYPGVFL